MNVASYNVDSYDRIYDANSLNYQNKHKTRPKCLDCTMIGEKPNIRKKTKFCTIKLLLKSHFTSFTWNCV